MAEEAAAVTSGSSPWVGAYFYCTWSRLQPIKRYFRSGTMATTYVSLRARCHYQYTRECAHLKKLTFATPKELIDCHNVTYNISYE
jgi:hypothetical protein